MFNHTRRSFPFPQSIVARLCCAFAAGLALLVADFVAQQARATAVQGNASVFYKSAAFFGGGGERRGAALALKGALQGGGNGGSWMAQTSGTSQSLSSVHFTSDTAGWAAGANATLLKTTDGGLNWNGNNTGVAAANGFNTVRFLDANTGFVGGVRDESRTTNGGATIPEPMTSPLVGQSRANRSSHLLSWFAPISAGVGRCAIGLTAVSGKPGGCLSSHS